MFESFLMSDDFLYTVAIIFTAIGLFAFSWIPYRAYCITAQLFQNKSNIFHFLAFFASLGILYIWSISFYKLIFKCIAGTAQMHCSGSRSGELLILLEVALSLVIFELVLFIFKFLKSKLYAAKFQNQGIGKYVLDFAEQYLHDKVLSNHCHSTHFVMWVLSVRHELIAYYQRRGYVQTGVVADYPLNANVGIPVIDLHLIEMRKRVPSKVSSN